ncbi:MAG: hypothetical protein V8T90_05240 [Victivallales bacterium]
MARQFGVVTGAGAVSGVILNSASRRTSVEWSEPTNEVGHVTDRKAISKTVSVSLSGILDTDGGRTLAKEAGASITVGDETFGVDSTDVTETKDAATFSLEASRKDEAEIHEYAAPEADTKQAGT